MCMFGSVWKGEKYSHTGKSTQRDMHAEMAMTTFTIKIQKEFIYKGTREKARNGGQKTLGRG